MSYQVKQGSLAGRLGTGIGKGLSEQLPKEIERGRLAQGLQQFSRQHPQSKLLKQYADLLSIPGVKESPQLLQTFGELARLDRREQAYANQGGGIPGQPQPDETVNPETITKATQEKTTPRETIDLAFEGEEFKGASPYRKELEENLPWTPEKKAERINYYNSLGFLPDESIQLTSDEEKRFLERPKAFQERQNQLNQRIADSRAELERQLELKTQKKFNAEKPEQNIFSSIIGENINNLEKEMTKLLVKNPNMSVQQAADIMSTRALHTAKAKTEFDSMIKTQGLENLNKGTQTLKKLYSFGDIFEESGNSEEYFNLLKQNKLSPQGAASIAFRPTKEVEKYIEKDYESVPFGSYKSARVHAKKIANEIADKITNKDSLLSIAWNLKKKDPNFDQESFFEELEKHKNKFNDRQKREFGTGTSDILPHWMDILIFPWFQRRGGK